MAFVLNGNGVLFVHIPKTAGIWCVEAMRAAGIDVRPVRSPGVHVRHALSWQCRDPRYRWDRAFAFVRHPLAWYESLWKFVNTPGASLEFGRPYEWHPFNGLPIEPGVPFDRFVASIIATRPDFLSRMFEAYIGPPDAPLVDVVGRCEDLPGSLIRCLEELDMPMDDQQRQAIFDCKPANVSRCNLGNPVWPVSLKRDVLHQERDAIERWYS